MSLEASKLFQVNSSQPRINASNQISRAGEYTAVPKHTDFINI